MTKMRNEEVREILQETLRDLRADKINYKSAVAVSRIASQNTSSLRLELEYAKMTGKMPHIPELESK